MYVFLPWWRRRRLVLNGHAEADNSIDTVEVWAVTICYRPKICLHEKVAEVYHISALGNTNIHTFIYICMYIDVYVYMYI